MRTISVCRPKKCAKQQQQMTEKKTCRHYYNNTINIKLPHFLLVSIVNCEGEYN